MDARQKRTSLKLAEVILRLADERRPSELTVSQVTMAAGINRSTFYQHAVSPTELLENVLRSELDAIRDRFLPQARERADSAIISDVTVAVLEHINSHARIYSRGLDASSGSSSLYPLLSEHFKGSVTQLLTHHNVELPTSITTVENVLGDVSPDDADLVSAITAPTRALAPELGGPVGNDESPELVKSPLLTGAVVTGDNFVAEAAARFIADGTVGAIEVWLRTPAPRSIDQFTAAYRLFIPSWWPLG
ncbi:MAG: TetR/AcrR family transcriptional regulator [Glaciihabitans sp.]|nr:TetR/AcrR family transcriptional regulator [Glaciihabitans sp.]